MSRSGYNDDCDGWALIRWRGAVAKAINGKRGQAFLREMLGAMDSLPLPQLIKNDLTSSDGVCAIGSVGRARQLAMNDLDPYDREGIAARFGIAAAMVGEIEFINDDDFSWRPFHQQETPEQRFQRVRKWIVEQLKAEPPHE